MSILTIVTGTGLNLVPQSVYDMQSAFYPTVANPFGVPLDTRHDYTENMWELFCAAIADRNTTDMFTHDIVSWINETPTNRALTDVYSTTGVGDYPMANFTFTARPTVGGFFSLLALPK